MVNSSRPPDNDQALDAEDDAVSSTATDAGTKASKVKKHWSHWLTKPLYWLTALVAHLSTNLLWFILLSVLGVAWLTSTNTGFHASLLLAKTFLPFKLTTENIHGNWSHGFTADQIIYDDDKTRVTLDHVALDYTPRSLLKKLLDVQTVSAESLLVEVTSTGRKSHLPSTIDVPFDIHIAQAKLDHLLIVSRKDGHHQFELHDMSAQGKTIGSGLDKHYQLSNVHAHFKGYGIDLTGEGEGEILVSPPFTLDTKVKAIGEQHLGSDKLTPVALEANLAMTGTMANHHYQLRATSAGNYQGLRGNADVQWMPFIEDGFTIRQAEIDLNGVNPAQFYKSAPHADLSIRTSFKPVENAGDHKSGTASKTPQTNLNNLVLAGPFEIKNLAPGSLDAMPMAIPLSMLKGQVSWHQDQFTFTQIQSTLYKGGQINGDVDLIVHRLVKGNLSDTANNSSAIAFTGDLDLKEINLQSLTEKIRPTQIHGRVQAKGDEHEQSFTAKLNDPIFDAQFQLVTDKTRLLLNEAHLLLKSGTTDGKAGEAQLSGQLQFGGAREFDLKGTISQFNPAVLLAMPTANLNGKVSAKGNLAGPSHLEAQADILDSWLILKQGNAEPQRRTLSGQASLRMQDKQITALDANLDLAGNTLKANGALGQVGQQLVLKIDAPAIGKWIPGLEGRSSVNAILEGALNQLALQADIAVNDLGYLSNGNQKQTLQQATAHLTASHIDIPAFIAGKDLNPALQNAQINLHAQANNYQHPKIAAINTEQSTLDIQGTLASHSLHGVWLGSTNKDHLDTHWQGGLNSSAGWSPLNWKGVVQTLEVIMPELAGNQVISMQHPAPLLLAGNQLEWRDILMHLPTQREANDLTLNISQLKWLAGQLQTAGQFSGLPIRREGLALRSRNRDSSRIDQPAILYMGGQWDLKVSDGIEGQLQITRESGDLFLDIDHREPARLSKLAILIKSSLRSNQLSDVDMHLEAEGERLGHTDSQIRLSLQKTAAGFGISPTQPFNLAIKANIPSLDWVGVSLGDRTQTGGSLIADIKASRIDNVWRSEGNLAADHLRIALIDSGIRLENGTIKAVMDGDSLNLSQMSFSSVQKLAPRDKRLEAQANEQGTLNVTGKLRLSSLDGEFLLDAQRFLAIQNSDRWLKVSGQTKIILKKDAASLTGQLIADGGLFYYNRRSARSAAPTLSDDIVIKGSNSNNTSNPNGFKLNFDLTANLGDKLYFIGEGVDTRLQGQVRLRSEPGRDNQNTIRANGTVELIDGTYEAYSQKLIIERGYLNFQGPLDNPGLDILALRKGLSVEAGVAITRTAANPLVKLYSNPAVSDYEKLSWLVFGRAPDQAGSGDSAILLSAASAILGGNKSGSKGFVSELAENLGFDQLSVSSGNLLYGNTILPSQTVAGATGLGTAAIGSTSAIGGSQTVGNQIVSVGKRLSAVAYISYEQALTGTGNLVKLTYQLSRRLSVIARAGTDNALDLVYAFSFD